MATDFKLPELGENIETIQVANILVKVGDTVEADQALFELETDKATIEVPANSAGTIAEILVTVGDDVEVGQTVLRIDDGGAAPAATPEPAAPAAAEKEPKVAPAADVTATEEKAPAAPDPAHPANRPLPVG